MAFDEGLGRYADAAKAALSLIALLVALVAAVFGANAAVEDWKDRFGPYIEESSTVEGEVTSVETRQEPAFAVFGTKTVTYVYYELEDGKAGAVPSDDPGFAELAGCGVGDGVQAERVERWKEKDKDGAIRTTYGDVRLATREGGRP